MKNPVQSNSFASQLGINFTFMVVYLAALSAFGSFVNDMYLPSLPSMCRFFGCSVPTVQMGLTMGMIGLAAGQFFLGPISDKYGRKITLYISMILFTIASAVSIFSPTIYFFLGCRLFQGLGASGAYFLAKTIPADVFQGRQLAKTMAIIGAINGFAPAGAPVIGGIVSDHFSWKGVFVVLTAIGVILLFFAHRLKETHPKSMRSNETLAKAFGEYKLLLTKKNFMIHVLLKGGALGLLFAYISSAPFIIEDHYGYSQTSFGLFMGLNAIFVVVGSLLSLRFKVFKQASLCATIIIVISVAAEAVVLLLTHSFWLYEILMWPILFGLGMIFSVSNTLAMDEGRENAGGAAAILGIGGYLFGAIVSPLVGTGNILHSTAWVFIAIALFIAFIEIFSARLPVDADMKK